MTKKVIKALSAEELKSVNGGYADCIDPNPYHKKTWEPENRKPLMRNHYR